MLLSAPRIPSNVYSGQSPPPWALSLSISSSNSPASVSRLTITGSAFVGSTGIEIYIYIYIYKKGTVFKCRIVCLTLPSVTWSH